MAIRINDLEKQALNSYNLKVYEDTDTLTKRCYILPETEESEEVIQSLCWTFIDIIAERIGEEVYFTAPTYRFALIENYLAELI